MIYQKNDLVEYAGSEYLATEDVGGAEPPAAPWQLFLSAGAEGESGAHGDTGPEGPKGDTGATGATGDSAYQVWLDAGSAGTEDGSLDSPQGEMGPPGPKGDAGLEGPPESQGRAEDPGGNRPSRLLWCTT